MWNALGWNTHWPRKLDVDIPASQLFYADPYPESQEEQNVLIQTLLHLIPQLVQCSYECRPLSGMSIDDGKSEWIVNLFLSRASGVTRSELQADHNCIFWPADISFCCALDSTNSETELSTCKFLFSWWPHSVEIMTNRPNGITDLCSIINLIIYANLITGMDLFEVLDCLQLCTVVTG